MEDRVLYMQEALAEARAAADAGEVPVGAVIVKDGEIIARAHNCVEADRRCSAHAEMLVVQRAEAALNAKWLTGCDLYVTLEPCAMCAGALVLARVHGVYIGAMDPKNGACGSIFNVLQNDRLNHRAEVETGILGEECGQILSDFFRSMRKVRLQRRQHAESSNTEPEE